MMRFSLILIVTVACVSIDVFGQQKLEVEEVLERLTHVFALDNPDEMQSWHEELTALGNQAVDLNNASQMELERLFFLSDFQKHSLYQYLIRYRPVLTFYELLGVHGFDREIVEILSLFVVLQARKKSFRWQDLARGRHVVMMNSSRLIQKQRAYQIAVDEGGYTGSSFRASLRYQYNLYGRLHAGLFVDKDPGEAFFVDTPRKGIAYLGAYIACQPIGRLNQLVLGRYWLSYGQGLVMGSGMGLYKSTDVFHAGPVSSGIRGYSSLNESNYLQGVASRLRLTSTLYWDFFISSARKDAGLNEKGEITSFYTAGYHRTKNEMAKRKNYNERIGGSALQYVGRFFSAGLLYLHHGFTNNVNPSSDVHNVHRFRGSDYDLLSVYSKWNFRSLSFYQEFAGYTDRYALQVGFIAKLTAGIGISCSYRDYSPNYYAPYASGFSESGISNEQGVYMGTKIELPRGYSISAYADVFAFPWLRYSIKSPSYGADHLIHLQRKTRRCTYYLRIAEKRKMQTVSDQTMPECTISRRYKYRTNLLAHVHTNWRLQSRAEMVRYKYENETLQGLLLLQDFRYRTRNQRLQCTFRVVFFHAESYPVRLYAYEPDLLYEYAVPAFQGEGSRSFMMVKWKLFSALQIGLKYGYTYYPGQSVLGSGLAEIAGPYRSDVKAQLIWKP